MRAAYLSAPGRMAVDDFPVPDPGPGQLLVRIDWASICGSDVHRVYDGLHEPERLGAPGYPGHEGVGEVVESRSPSFAVGQPVLAVPAGPVGGCFAEYQVFDAGQLVPLRAGGDGRRLLPAQQLGTTIFALNRFLAGIEAPTAQDCAVVIGAGSAGLFFVQLLRRHGFGTVACSDPCAPRLELAGRLGADLLVGTGADSLASSVEQATRGAGAGLVIEAAGYDASRAEAIDVVRIGGTVGCFGFPEARGSAPFPVHTAFRKAVQVRFISGTQAEPGLRSFHAAIDAVESGAIEVGYCLTPPRPLEQLPTAMADARACRAVKINIAVAAQPNIRA